MTNLQTLKQALLQLGFTVTENGTARAYQASKQCDLVITLAGAYDIGWNLTEQGTLEMHWDARGIRLTYDPVQLMNAIAQAYGDL